MSDAPAVSVVVAVYLSEETLGGFLDALARQTFRDFETVLVDSGPTDACARLVEERPEPLVFFRSATRLGPQAARAEGVRRSRGHLLVFTDPDVYAAPDWLDRLVAAHRETGGPVAGALRCHLDAWLDRGIHLCKFSKWLPAGGRRPVDMGPTANLLVPRRDFEAVGGFRGDSLLGDVTLGRDLIALGRPLLLEPAAVVDHHHLMRLGPFLRERWSRGIRYGRLRGGWLRARKARLLALLGGSFTGLRVASNLVHCARHSWRAGEGATFLATFPVVLLGFAASVAGEAVGYAGVLLGASRGSESS